MCSQMVKVSIWTKLDPDLFLICTDIISTLQQQSFLFALLIFKIKGNAFYYKATFTQV